MLSAHPRIAIPPETKFVMDGYDRRSRWGDLADPAKRRRLARWVVRRRSNKVRDLGLKRRDLVAAIVAGPPTLGSAFGVVLREYAAAAGKLRWGDKRPKHHQDVAALLRMFPDAQFVHIIRDGRDCVASLKQMRWHRGGSLVGTDMWAHAIDSGRRWQQRLPADTWHEVRYERLVSEPRSALRALCAFLGEDFAESMLRPDVVASRVIPERKAHHARLRGTVDAARVGAFAGGLSPAELGLFEAVNGRRLTSYGYALSGRGERPDPALLARYAAVRAQRHASLARRRLRDQWTLRRHPMPLAARLTSGQLALSAAGADGGGPI